MNFLQVKFYLQMMAITACPYLRVPILTHEIFCLILFCLPALLGNGSRRAAGRMLAKVNPPQQLIVW